MGMNRTRRAGPPPHKTIKCENYYQSVSSEIAGPGTGRAEPPREAAFGRNPHPPAAAAPEGGNSTKQTKILLGWAKGPVQQNSCFVVLLGRRFGAARGSGFLRSGGPLSCAARPRSAARPRPAPPFGAPSPLGRLGAVVGPPPSPLPPSPCGGGGCSGSAAGHESTVMMTAHREPGPYHETRSTLPTRIRDGGRGPGPPPAWWVRKGKGRFRTQGHLTIPKMSNESKKGYQGAHSTP